jgi:hypothetical protein
MGSSMDAFFFPYLDKRSQADILASHILFPYGEAGRSDDRSHHLAPWAGAGHGQHGPFLEDSEARLPADAGKLADLIGRNRPSPFFDLFSSPLAE